MVLSCRVKSAHVTTHIADHRSALLLNVVAAADFCHAYMQVANVWYKYLKARPAPMWTPKRMLKAKKDAKAARSAAQTADKQQQ
jgi:hypothetical protein